MRFGVVFLRSIEADLRGGVEGIIVTSASSSEGLSYAMAHRQGAVRESIRGVLSGRSFFRAAAWVSVMGTQFR